MSRLERDSKPLLRTLICLAVTGLVAPGADGQTNAPQAVSFTTRDGGEIHGDLYGEGESGVVLAHGAVFDREGWRPLARSLTENGHVVLAFDFRGYGSSTAGSEGRTLHLDVLGAVTFLRRRGVETISLVGASMGGGACAQAATEAPIGALHGVVLLAPAPIASPDAMKAERFLFVASRNERGLPIIRDQFERAPEPKVLELLDGSAHAQHVFKTEQAQRLTDIIVGFLSGGAGCR